MFLSIIQNRIATQNLISSRLLSGIGWSVAGSGLSYTCKLLSSVIIARILGQIDFGKFGLITSTILLFGTFAGLGLGMTGTKYLAEYRQDLPRAGRVIALLLMVGTLLGIILATLTYSIVPFLSANVLNSPQLYNELYIGSYFLLFSVLVGVELGILAGFEQFRTLAVISIFEGLSLLALTFAGAFWGGLQGAIWGFGAGAFVTWIVCSFYLVRYCLKSDIHIALEVGGVEWMMLWEFALPSLIILICTQPFVWFTRIILANQPGGYAELGLLNVGFVWGQLLIFLPRQISKPALPIMTNMIAEHNVAGFKRVFKSNLYLSLAVTLVLVLPVAFLSKVIMGYYGSDFEPGWLVLTLMVVAYGIGAITIAFRDIIAALGQMWWQAGHSLVWGMLLITIAYGLRAHGAVGIASAFCVAYLCLVCIQTIYLHRSLNFVSL